MKIRVTRSSVCAGDDFFAPHNQYIEYREDEMLLEWFERLKDYVAKVKDSVAWRVDSSKKCLGYLVGDEDGNLSVKLAIEDIKVADLGIDSIHCSYFSDRKQAGV